MAQLSNPSCFFLAGASQWEGADRLFIGQPQDTSSECPLPASTAGASEVFKWISLPEGRTRSLCFEYFLHDISWQPRASDQGVVVVAETFKSVLFSEDIGMGAKEALGHRSAL